MVGYLQYLAACTSTEVEVALPFGVIRSTYPTYIAR